MSSICIQLMVAVVTLSLSDVVASQTVHNISIPDDDHSSRQRPQAEPLTEQQIAEIVDVHNQLRAGEGADDMKLITWDTSLASLAATSATECTTEPATFQKEHGNVGQTSYYTISNRIINLTKGIIDLWYNGKTHYTYDTMECAPGKYCGNYLQVVWADTTGIGCAIHHCSTPSPSEQERDEPWWLMVCKYQPGWVAGENPYTKDLRGEPLALTEEQKSEVVDYLNHLRAREDARKMAVIAWNASLESQAAARAARCDWSFGYEIHNNTGQSRYIFHTTNLTEAMSVWYSGKYYYDYDNMWCADKSEGHCDEYLQIVWANTTDVGCALHHCSAWKMTGASSPPRIWNLVCRYWPAVKRCKKPYTKYYQRVHTAGLPRAVKSGDSTSTMIIKSQQATMILVMVVVAVMTSTDTAL